MHIWSDKWHAHWLGMAKYVSKPSKDPSTKCGAIIVDPKNRLVSTGYNGFPRGVDDSPELYANREEKYRRVVHAEMNAILFAHRDLTDCSLYVWPFLTCERCAVHVIQSGVKYVYAPRNDNPRWKNTFVLANELYAEAGVSVSLFSYPVD